MAHGYYCCCGEDDCTEYLIDFDDGTDGALTVTSTVGTFTYEDIDGGGVGDKELVYGDATPGEKLWEVPTTDDGTTTRIEVSVYVHGDGEVGSGQNTGGPVFQLPGLRIEYGIEAGDLIYRVTVGAYTFGGLAWLVTPSVPVRFLISLTPYCDGRTWVVLRRGTEEPPQAFLIPFTLDPFPTEFEGGIYIPQDDVEPPPAHGELEGCCVPNDEDCYQREGTLTGFVTGDDIGSYTLGVEPLTYSEAPILCGGVSIDGNIDAPTFVAANGYMIGQVPWDDGFGNHVGQRIVLFCDGGTLKAFTIEADNCPQGNGLNAITEFTCDSFTGNMTFRLSWNQSLNCPSCNGYIEVEITTTICEGEGDPRAFDDVIFRACGGAEVPPCPPPEPSDCGECADTGTTVPTVFVLIEDGGQNCFPAGVYQLPWVESACSWSFATGSPGTCTDCSNVHCIGISATPVGMGAVYQLSWQCGTVGQGCFGSGALYEKSGGGCTSPQGTYLLVSGDGPPSVEVF
jgi:hypothetical protein